MEECSDATIGLRRGFASMKGRVADLRPRLGDIELAWRKVLGRKICRKRICEQKPASNQPYRTLALVSDKVVP